MTLKKKNAVTFVEMIVATAIFTVMMGVLFELFSSGKVFWTTHENKITVQRETRQALDRMSRELREAGDIGDIVIAQDADNATISFPRVDMGNVTYQWANTGADANKILRTYQSATTIVASNISALSFTPE